MSLSKFETPVLLVSGLIAVLVGCGILIAPQTFYAASGIAIGQDISLHNELRAPGGLIVLTGGLACVGAFVVRWRRLALIVSAIAYGSFGASRDLSILIDGWPNSAMVQVTVLELVLAAICFAVLQRPRAAIAA